MRAYSYNQLACVTHQDVSSHLHLVFKLTKASGEEATTEPSNTEWELALDSACNTGAGESYMRANSAGRIPNMEACKRRCEDVDECQSITYYPTRWCSLFRTPCLNQKMQAGATAGRKPRNFQFANVKISAGNLYMQINTYVCKYVHTLTYIVQHQLPTYHYTNIFAKARTHALFRVMPMSTTHADVSLMQVKDNTEYDTDAGETYVSTYLPSCVLGILLVGL